MNKVVLITGGSRGLGVAISSVFAFNNYNLIIVYKNNEEAAHKLKNDFEKKYHVNVDIYKCNVNSEDDIAKMYKDIGTKYNQIDCIVNNAGVANDSVMFDKTKDDFMRVYETNLVGAFLIVKYGKTLLSDSSSIINIASDTAIDANYPYSADYDASKAALISLTHNMALELAPIRVNAVAPGWINTDMNKDMDKEYKQNECNKILLKRFANPDEIANVVYFLASDEASYINNSVIKVDGGKYGC